MADTKKKKSTPAKKTAAKKAPAKKPAEKKVPEPKQTEEKAADKKVSRDPSGQFTSVLLFAAGVLLGTMVFVEGSSGWKVMHEILHGLFGIGAVMIPVTLLYSAIMIGRDKSNEKTARRLWCGFGLTLLISGALQIFTVGKLPEGTGLEMLSQLFYDGKHLSGGGAASAALAFPLLKFMGKLGARVLMVVAIFVLIMFLTGSGLNDLFGIIGKPFRLMGNGVKEFGEWVQRDDENDDYDDEPERRSFEKDIEAVDMISAPKPVPERNIRFSQPAAEEPADDGFLMDIQIPTDDQIHTLDDDFEIFPENPPKKRDIKPKRELEMEPEQERDDSSLEELITKAADSKTMELPPFDIDEEIAKEPELPAKPVYIRPPLDLLANADNRVNRAEAMQEMRDKADVIVNTLRSFGVEVKIKDIFRGPAITRYEVQPGVGVKVKKITGLADDIALSLAAQGVRIAPVPGKSAIGIEIPNGTKDMVTLREILSVPDFRNASSKLTFAVGKDITGNVILGDIAKMPHVIIAGTTGSGKSVCTRSIIMSILFNADPDEVKLILIDPKIVEFKVFDGIPHLLIPIVVDVKKAAGALGWAVNEMMRRYTMFADVGANDLKSYNELAEMDGDIEKMPQIVIFIDELADMMLVAKNEVEDSIQRLAQMGRAAGMHLVVATQRPTTDVITGIIKANIPSRIALSVKSQVDSRTIIDCAGAEKLLGNGDMLYMPIGASDPVRVQGCFASNKDISATLDFIKAQYDEVVYDKSIEEAVDSFVPASKGDHSDGGDAGYADGSDEDYVERAIKVAVDAGQLSTSMLQRKLKLGYARAARIMDELEDRGVIGPSEGAKPRRVLMSKMQYDERRMRMEMD
ncbi:MAG: DNA translocase FtsK [Ruminococcus sp.]|nr:DNA translocase FtsK [Ruminococcus sp.]